MSTMGTPEIPFRNFGPLTLTSKHRPLFTTLETGVGILRDSTMSVATPQTSPQTFTNEAQMKVIPPRHPSFPEAMCQHLPSGDQSERHWSFDVLLGPPADPAERWKNYHKNPVNRSKFAKVLVSTVHIRLCSILKFLLVLFFLRRLIIPHIEVIQGLSVLAPGFKAILMTYFWWNKWHGTWISSFHKNTSFFLPQKTDWHSHSK